MIDETAEACGARVDVDGSAGFEGIGTAGGGMLGCAMGRALGASSIVFTFDPTSGHETIVLAATVSSFSVADAALIETGDVCAGDGRSVARSDGEAGDMDVVRASGASAISTVCAMGFTHDAVDSSTWTGGGAAAIDGWSCTLPLESTKHAASGTLSTADTSFENRNVECSCTGRGSGAAFSKTSDASESRPLMPSESNCSLDKPSRDHSGKTQAPSKEIDERGRALEDCGKSSGTAAANAC